MLAGIIVELSRPFVDRLIPEMFTQTFPVV
jgi:hypothetical protein